MSRDIRVNSVFCVPKYHYFKSVNFIAIVIHLVPENFMFCYTLYFFEFLEIFKFRLHFIRGTLGRYCTVKLKTSLERKKPVVY